MWTSLGLLALAVAPAQELIEFTAADSYLGSMDPKTGAWVAIGDTGIGSYWWTGMAKDDQGTLYAVHGDLDHPFVVYEIDPATAQATFVVQTDLVGIQGVSFGPGGLFYAVAESSYAGPDSLYTIDLQTGVSTLVGPTGAQGIESLAFDGADLYAWDHDNPLGGGPGLVRIDAVTGIAHDVSPRIGQGHVYTHPGIGTLAFSDDGALYGAGDALYLVDLESGQLTFVTAYVPSPNAMEFAPGEPEPFSLTAQGRTGGRMRLSARGATPGGDVAFFYALDRDGSAVVPPLRPCAGALLDLRPRVFLVDLKTADATGRAVTHAGWVPDVEDGCIRIQALDLATCTTTNRGRPVF